MLLLSLLFLTITLLTLLLLFLISSLPQKAFCEEEKLSPFECGFLPQKPARSPFSIHFFLLAILFLVFDVELVLLFPWLLTKAPVLLSKSYFMVFLFLLTLGLLYEWNAKMLDWID